TVGAIQPDLSYWPKSNWSASYVDIAAPGCGLETYQWSANSFQKVKVSGTSFAAPLVSFAGNLLKEFNTGVGRKTRIVKSGRYNAGLAGKVQSTRYLDVPAALATTFDVVRDNAGKLRLGQITWTSGNTICTLGSKSRPEIAQVSRVD